MYTVGEKVVHPMHGAGVITEITEERMSGGVERYYVFTAPLSGLTLKIPVGNSGAVGLRQPISRQQLSVIKGLMSREARRGLSTVERKMLRSAKQILLSEVMLVENLSYDGAEQLLSRSVLTE